MRRKIQGPSEPDINGTGSHIVGEPVYLAIGRLGKPHGLDGGIIFYIITDFPERLIKGKKIFIGEEKIPAILKSVKEHSRGLIFQFEEYSTFEEIEKFKTYFLYVEADELPKLPEGEYYHHQLIGLNVFDKQENKIGVITNILETGANDVYVIIDEDQKEILFPALLHLIDKIDIENKLMIITPLEYYNQG
jgi:16S rRNA processing protein RimM